MVGHLSNRPRVMLGSVQRTCGVLPFLVHLLFHSCYGTICRTKLCSVSFVSCRPPADDLRLRCPSCRTRFLNIAPEKLLLGTSVLLQQHQQQQHIQGQVQAQPGEQGAAPGLVSSTTQATAAASGSIAAATDPSQAAGYAASAAAAGYENRRYDTADGEYVDPYDELYDSRELVVDERAVLEVVARTTGLPLQSVWRDHAGAAVGHLRQALEARVVGQREAVRAVCAAVQLHRLGLGAAGRGAERSPQHQQQVQQGHGGNGGSRRGGGQQRRPVASFLMMGPPGCGKATLCQVGCRGRQSPSCPERVVVLLHSLQGLVAIFAHFTPALLNRTSRVLDSWLVLL